MSQVEMARSVAVIGGGPAGLMAAEVLADAGVPVDLYDAMPSVGRKFLLAGKGGLNLTHAEEFDAFVQRYAERAPQVQPWLRGFGADAIRAWARGLGIETFVGSSHRVFPSDMKAAPLLRAWLHRLRSQGVRFHMRHRWQGYGDDGALLFGGPSGLIQMQPLATVLALGGASWARLGSDGAWVPWLLARGVDVAPLAPSNCGFDVGWSDHLRHHFAGHALKNVAIAVDDGQGGQVRQQGEFIITEGGVEGSLVYAVSAILRRSIAAQGSATFHVDLLPGRSAQWVERELAHPRGTRSLATHLKSRLKLSGVKAALLHETLLNEPSKHEALADVARLAAQIKALPISVKAARPIDEAISTAGGVRLEAMDDQLMLRASPGTFCAGEMLDWEAPTGGYLITASMASGRAAGLGLLRWLARDHAVHSPSALPDTLRRSDF
jgi:uncharacterized flavoprotein (TIGR03862 family)